ncbi:MAG: ferritin-like domain-containing protein [Myxococcota bacterium]|nr:ferritin-like domain-containing protein [Myxococcota bacterium]
MHAEEYDTPNYWLWMASISVQRNAESRRGSGIYPMVAKTFDFSQEEIYYFICNGEVFMNIHRLLFTTLALVGCGSSGEEDSSSAALDDPVDCVVPTGGDCDSTQYPFEVDEIIYAGRVQQLVNLEYIGSLENLTCDMFCQDYVYISQLDTCEFTLDFETLPEDFESVAADTAVGTIQCTGMTEEVCEGRRPIGYVEQNTQISGLGSFFAQTAQLETASILAFLELARQLKERGAPAHLIHRCLQAADDEVHHARAFLSLAKMFGAEVPNVIREEAAEDLFSIALHNAVEGCVFETWAALKAHYRSIHAHNPALRKLYAMVASDETRHGQLAWDIHAWFMSQLTRSEQERVLCAQREAFVRLKEIASKESESSFLGALHPSDAKMMAQHLKDALSA